MSNLNDKLKNKDKKWNKLIPKPIQNYMLKGNKRLKDSNIGLYLLK